MSEIIVRIKDETKLQAIVEFLEQLDFLEVRQTSEEGRQEKSEYKPFQASFGCWANRDIDAGKLRKKAWERSE